MTISRRRFLEVTALGAGALALPGLGCAKEATGTPTPQNILVLGGTGFIGPHMVKAALDRGHSVTLFNRGRTNTHLFPEVEKLIGDRNGELDALRGRTWDAVIDNSGYFVSHVRQSAELLAGSVNHYLFTSTVDAYQDYNVMGIDENYPLGRRPEGAPENPSLYYGPLKAECEDVIQEIYPDNNTRVRPGWIAGPGDNNHLFTYWVMRVAKGGEMMAPGEPTDPFQITDVRDIGNWYIHILENQIFGAYNAVGRETTMGAMLEDLRTEMGSTATFTWVDKDFMFERGAKPWDQIPIWYPPVNDWGEASSGGNTGGIGSLSIDGNAAWAQGMHSMTIAQTGRDTHDWFAEEFGDWPPPGRRRPGLTAELEAGILRDWHAR